MPAPTLILTIAPDGHTLSVTLRQENGTLAGPPRVIAVNSNYRLAAFVAAVQEIAGQQFASVKAPAIGRTGDGDPAIADATHGEQVR